MLIENIYIACLNLISCCNHRRYRVSSLFNTVLMQLVVSQLSFSSWEEWACRRRCMMHNPSLPRPCPTLDAILHTLDVGAKGCTWAPSWIASRSCLLSWASAWPAPWWCTSGPDQIALVGTPCIPWNTFRLRMRLVAPSTICLCYMTTNKYYMTTASDGDLAVFRKKYSLPAWVTLFWQRGWLFHHGFLFLSGVCIYWPSVI